MKQYNEMTQYNDKTQYGEKVDVRFKKPGKPFPYHPTPFQPVVYPQSQPSYGAGGGGYGGGRGQAGGPSGGNGTYGNSNVGYEIYRSWLYLFS